MCCTIQSLTTPVTQSNLFIRIAASGVLDAAEIVTEVTGMTPALAATKPEQPAGWEDDDDEDDEDFVDDDEDLDLGDDDDDDLFDDDDAEDDEEEDLDEE